MTLSESERPPDLTEEYELTVVVGADGPPSSLESCLGALEHQRSGTQVLVMEARESDDELRARFPWAEFHTCPDALVPELWRNGIARSRGRIVALTISPMIPADDWIEAHIRAHETHDAVGGAIDPGRNLRPVDWAEYFCRYSRDMAPFEPNDRDELASDNASYKRELLFDAWAHLQAGFWEPVIHPVLRELGARFWHTPDVLVRQGRSSGFRAFARQRSEHGRRFARQRGSDFTGLRHAIGILASPAVPFVMTARVLRRVFAKGRHRARLVMALPLVFLLNAAWAAAEARGHLEVLLGEDGSSA